MRFNHTNVLLIEDDVEIRDLVRKLLNSLEEYSFGLQKAGNLTDGLDLLKMNEFQAIILDLNLPDSLGIESLKTIKAAEPDIPVVVLTGLGSSDMALKVLEMGAEEYLDKGYLTGQLLARTIHFAIERKKNADKIQAEKAQKELILDSLFERVLMVDKDMNILWANKSARRDTKNDLADAIGRPCQEYLGRGERYCADCILKQVLSEGVHKTTEVQSAKGKTYVATGTPVLDHNGELVGAVEASLDVTQLKAAEKALQASQMHYKQLVQNAIDIIYHIDLKGNFTFINQAVENILGYTPEELIGSNAWDFKGGELYLEALEHNQKSFSAGKKQTYLEFPVSHKNGSKVWLGQNLWQVEDANGTIGYQAIARDITDLKKTRDALEEAYQLMEERIQTRTAELEEAKLQWERTFDAVPDRLAIIDMDYRLLRVNTAMAKAMGGEPEELTGKICREVAGCSSSAIQQCPHTLMMADKQTHAIEFYDQKNNIALSVSAAPLYDKNNELIGCVHVSRDITDMKKAERALQGQLNFQQKLMDTIPNPVFFKDREGIYTGCNRAFESFMGIPRHGIIGRTVFDLWETNLAEIYHEQDLDLYAKRGTQQHESQIRNAAGDVRDVIFNKAIYYGTGEDPAGLVGIIVDITGRRQTERKLASSEERYRTLVETLSEGLIIVDQNLAITFANRRFKEMVGIRKDEDITTLNLFDFMDEENQKIVSGQYERRRKGADDTYEAAFTSRDGTIVPSLISPKPIFNSSKEFRGSLALVTDITERKKLESQLSQAQKLESIGQLAAGIAHEINTPTQYVLSNTKFLEGAFDEFAHLMDAYVKLADETSKIAELSDITSGISQLAKDIDLDFLTEEIPNAIAANVEGLERIAKIVSSMKAFAHPGEEDFSPTDLNQALENTVTVARSEWKYVADVELDLDRTLPFVPCLAAELNQVFLNIIVNAAQAIGEVVREGESSKGRILIKTSFDTENAEIRITDDGPGIPAEIQGRLFDPFFTTKEPGKGTGQGLAIAYRVVVERHKGHIWLNSKPGEGTEFCILLPLVR